MKIHIDEEFKVSHGGMRVLIQHMAELFQMELHAVFVMPITRPDLADGMASYNDGYVIIEIATKNCEDFVAGTIIHEMTHVWQTYTGRLICKKKGFVWEGKKYPFSYKKMGKMTMKEYKRLPWEREAYTMQKLTMKKLRGMLDD